MVPTEMRVAEIENPGAPDVLRPATRPVPTLGNTDVLIQVRAAGVNRPDVMQREGNYPPPAGASDIPGLEVAGEVVARGADVSKVSLGDEVCALVAGGGYAEYCAAPAELCLPKPAGFSWAEAAALPETFFTVWTNVFDRGRLKRGESLLVHGGSSGIGTTAIALAKGFDATVYVTCGSDDKARACLDLGARAAINYRDEVFEERILELTDGRGVDVLLDMVGGPYFPRNIKCMAEEGRIVQIAVQQGPKTELNLLSVMLKRLTITGSTLRPRPVEKKAEIAGALRDNVWPLLGQAVSAPPIHETFSLGDAAGAHALMESSAHIGKIVLLVD